MRLLHSPRQNHPCSYIPQSYFKNIVIYYIVYLGILLLRFFFIEADFWKCKEVNCWCILHGKQLLLLFLLDCDIWECATVTG